MTGKEKKGKERIFETNRLSQQKRRSIAYDSKRTLFLSLCSNLNDDLCITPHIPFPLLNPLHSSYVKATALMNPGPDNHTGRHEQ